MKKQNTTLFQNKYLVPVFAAMAALAWASAFPLIKLGIAYFNIAAGDTGAKTLFAGIRFFLAGVLVLLLARITGRSLKIGGKKEWGLLILFGIVNTALHYFFFYLGLSNSTGSRSAILDSLGTFLLILFACLFFKEEKLTWRKIIGCLLGFGGILLMNLGSSLQESGAFTLRGDGMILCSAVCAAFGGILTRIATQKSDALTATGYSLAIGGFLLILTGLLMGGRLTELNGKGLGVLCLLIFVSSLGFSFYNQLICLNPVGEIAIYNALIPVMGVLLSCIILKEPFSVKYLFAGVLVSAGICVINITHVHGHDIH